MNEMASSAGTAAGVEQQEITSDAGDGNKTDAPVEEGGTVPTKGLIGADSGAVVRPNVIVGAMAMAASAAHASTYRTWGFRDLRAIAYAAAINAPCHRK